MGLKRKFARAIEKSRIRYGKGWYDKLPQKIQDKLWDFKYEQLDRSRKIPKGADLSDVFKAKNIKDPKTFLKKRKEVVGKMTKSRRKDIKRQTKEKKEEAYEAQLILKKRREHNVSKRGGDHWYKRFRKGGNVPGMGAPDRKKTPGSLYGNERINPMTDEQRLAPMTAEQRKEFAKRLFGPGGSKINELARSIAKARKPSGTLNKDDLDRAHQVLRGMGLSKTQGMAKGGKVKNYQTGGEVDADLAADQIDYAKSILNIARRRKPSGVITQDDINAAKEEFYRRRELQKSRQAETDPIPMPKTSKRSLVKPMEKREPTFTPGPGYFKKGPSDQFEADITRRPKQDRYTIDEGMVIKPTDDYIRGRLGMKEGGSVSSKPKHRGWGKAIKGTIFKGTK